eukprot:6166969-Pleurochrysis_carterae.AAC.3
MMNATCMPSYYARCFTLTERESCAGFPSASYDRGWNPEEGANMPVHLAGLGDSHAEVPSTCNGRVMHLHSK